MNRLLNEKYIQITDLLKKISTFSKLDSNLVSKDLTNINEDIHWILLVSGFILFDINSEANECLISNEVMKYSFKSNGIVDIYLVKCLSPELSMQLIDSKLHNLDAIMGLFFNSFQLCELETQIFSLNMFEYLSPVVSTTLMWYLKEMVRSYLFMKESCYDELSSTFLALFGVDTDCGVQIINFLLRKLIKNFSLWKSENGVLNQTVRLLLEMVKNRNINKILIKNKEFWLISKIAYANEDPWVLLPPNIKKAIIKSFFVSLSNASLDSQNFHMHYLETILKPIEARFSALDSNLNLHAEGTIKETMNLVETFNGILEGVSINVVKDLLPFPVILNRLRQGVELLDKYHNYGEIVELILEMFNCTVEKFLINVNDDFLNEETKIKIYTSLLSLIQIFSKHNSGKYTR